MILRASTMRGVSLLPRHGLLMRVQPARSLIGNPFSGKDSREGGKSAKKAGIQELLAIHGPAALVTYGLLTLISFTSFYVGIQASGVNPSEIMHALPFLSHSPATGPKDNAPTSPPPTKEEDSISQKIDSALERGAEAVRSGIESVEEAIDHMDHFLESQDANSHHAASPGHPSTTGTVLVALAVHELFLPVRLALTAALTPRVAARMKGTLVDLWMRKAGAGILRVKDVVKGALFPGSRRNPPPPPTRPT